MRVLLLTHRLPYEPNRGDRIRAYHLIESLKGRVDLDIVSLVHDRDEMAAALRMRDAGYAVSAKAVSRLRNLAFALPQLTSTRPLTHLLLQASGMRAMLRRIVAETPPDVVLAYCSGMARFAVEPPLDHIPRVVDLVDVDSAKWAAMAATASAPMRWIYRREARCLGAFERDSATGASDTMVVNDREAEALQRLAPAARIRVVPNGIDLATFKPTGAPLDGARVVFCGVMNYSPNVEGVLWFTREVWPRIRERRPDARFVIVGSDPVAAVRELASSQSGIEVTGTVTDVRQYLWNSSVSVAPLKTARGVQNKVLEALAAGLPAVITTQVFEGLPLEAHRGCRVAETASAFADDTVALLDLPAGARRAVANQADLSSLSWSHQLGPVFDILAAAAATSTARSAR